VSTLVVSRAASLDVLVESEGLVVAGEGVSQAIKPRQATKARKNKFFIK